MSKVLIVVCLAIVTPMVSWTAAQSSEPKAGNGSTFIGNFIKDEVQLSFNEYTSANTTLFTLYSEIDLQLVAWYTDAVEKLALIWINKAKMFLAKQAHGELIPQQCLQIQQNLFNYGSLVAERLVKCVNSHRLIAQYFVMSLLPSIQSSYWKQYGLIKKADDCALQTDFGSTLGCQGKVLLEFMRAESVKNAVQRHVFAAETYAKTVKQQLDNCPYLANMVEYENKATRAAIDAIVCTQQFAPRNAMYNAKK